MGILVATPFDAPTFSITVGGGGGGGEPWPPGSAHAIVRLGIDTRRFG